MSSEIRPALEADLSALYGLDHVAGDNVERRELVHRAVQQRRSWVIEQGGAIRGYAVISHEFFSKSFLELVYIDEQYRGRGLGPDLIRFMESRARSASIFTSTNASNLHMQHVLETLGYERSGVIYNLDPDDPELVYVKHKASLFDVHAPAARSD